MFQNALAQTYNPEAMPNIPADIPTIDPNLMNFNASYWMGIMMANLVVTVVMYVIVAYFLMKIAKKAGRTDSWMAWIPILNLVLMIQIAGKPWWWIFLFIIPIVNIILAFYIWIEIAKKMGKPGWYGVLMIVPFVNIWLLWELSR